MERLYPENAWVTPCELFKPYYGYTISNFILNQMENLRQKKLRILEIGPGTGTFADSLLDFFKNYNLDLYREIEFVFVEISPQLATQCEELMRQNHKKLFEDGKIKIFNGSFLDFTRKMNQHYYVIGLEILDNMPHDRLYLNQQGEFIQQANVKISTNEEGKEQLEEVKTEITDEWCKQFVNIWQNMPEMDQVQASSKIKSEGLIKRMLDVFSYAKNKETQTNNIFAPTKAMQLLTQIKDQIPDHSLILADFDSFIMPKDSIQGINAPLVTHKLKDPTQWKTFSTYLIERGEADICYPVDFFFLKHFYHHITGYQSNIYKTGEFMDTYALESWCQTQNLYNPMKEEYFNTSFLVTEHTNRQGN